MTPSSQSSANGQVVLDRDLASAIWNKVVDSFQEVLEHDPKYLENLAALYNLPSPDRLAQGYYQEDPVRSVQMLLKANPDLRLDTLLQQPPKVLAEDLLLATLAPEE